jgi:hypothetical protein
LIYKCRTGKYSKKAIFLCKKAPNVYMELITNKILINSELSDILFSEVNLKYTCTSTNKQTTTKTISMREKLLFIEY